jgi:hypothetical protein
LFRVDACLLDLFLSFSSAKRFALLGKFFASVGSYRREIAVLLGVD